MKKYIFLICILFVKPLYAENFIDALGAECAKVLRHFSNYEYPDRFKNEDLRNKQFTHLNTCLETYKENGGDIDILNKKYRNAVLFSSISSKECLAKENKENTNFCNMVENIVFTKVMIGEECYLYNETLDTFHLNFILEHCKNKE